MKRKKGERKGGGGENGKGWKKGSSRKSNPAGAVKYSYECLLRETEVERGRGAA